MNNCLRMKDIFKSYVDLDDFIFKRIKTSHNNIKYYTDTLDFEYIYSHSGNKYISPLVKNLLEDDNTIFERDPLEKLASEGQLMSYMHKGFWQCMDNIREKELLENLLANRKAPWVKWQD